MVSDKKNETITGIYVVGDGSVFVSTSSNGLIKLTSNHNNFTKDHFFQNYNITEIFRDKKGLLWTGNLNGKVFGFTDKLDQPQAEFNVEGNVQCFFIASPSKG